MDHQSIDNQDGGHIVERPHDGSDQYLGQIQRLCHDLEARTRIEPRDTKSGWVNAIAIEDAQLVGLTLLSSAVGKEEEEEGEAAHLEQQAIGSAQDVDLAAHSLKTTAKDRKWNDSMAT